MKNIKVSSCPNDVASYNIVVPLKNLVKDDASPRFWCFVNGKKIEQPLIMWEPGGNLHPPLCPTRQLSFSRNLFAMQP